MNAKSIIILLISALLFHSVASLKRSIFPADFVFGSASSAYQYEGAANEGGKGPSIWDTYTHKYLERIKDHSNGDVATDSYHRYKEDVAIMKDIGFNAYRFSISWSRILPNGSAQGGVNREGIAYYNNLINKLQAKGMQPFITLFHWDTPQGIEDAYGGFLSPKIVKDFADYADLCFREFGDRVKNWITFNEPYIYATDGYGNGGSPPSRCSPGPGVGRNCTAGDSSTEPYLAAHHQILAHAAAVKVYREKYKASQKGQIGITLNSFWFVPLSQSNADKEAASRGLAFMLEWFLQPIYSGAYPAVMVEKVGERLPKFSAEQSLMVKRSFDFIGFNYYTATYAADIPCQSGRRNVFTDSCVRFTTARNGVPIGPKAASDWLYIYPQGIQDLLQYTKEKYNNPVMYITENGLDELNDGKRSLNDLMRIGYMYHHLVHVHRAIRNGVRVKGYFAWSLLDNFEWNFGYTVRFGMVYVDYQNGQRRYYKRSAWCSNCFSTIEMLLGRFKFRVTFFSFYLNFCSNLGHCPQKFFDDF